MQSKKPNRFPSNASGVGLVFGEKQRRKAWRNRGLNGNLLLPFIFFNFCKNVISLLHCKTIFFCCTVNCSVLFAKYSVYVNF